MNATHYCRQIMAGSNHHVNKKRGRPRTGINPAVGVRLPPALLEALDKWRLRRQSALGRPEAIRRLIEANLVTSNNPGRTTFDVPNAPQGKYTKSSDIGLADFSPSHCRAARALLSWSQEDLARLCKITKKTIADFERGVTTPLPQTLTQIIEAFVAEGIEFLNGGSPGARLKAKEDLRSPR